MGAPTSSSCWARSTTLPEATDRGRALREARRGPQARRLALRRRHLALGVGPGRPLPGLFQDPRFAAIVEQDLREGRHRNPTERLDYFTTAYFHRPDELRQEVLQAGLNLEGLYSSATGVYELGFIVYSKDL